MVGVRAIRRLQRRHGASGRDHQRGRPGRGRGWHGRDRGCRSNCRKRLERVGDCDCDAIKKGRGRRRVGKHKAANRRVRALLAVVACVELRRAVLARDDKEGVRLQRLVGDLPAWRFGRKPGVEGCEIVALIGSKIELPAEREEFRRRAYPRPRSLVRDSLEAHRVSRLEARRKQSLNEAWSKHPVRGRPRAALPREDCVARARAEIAIVRRIVEAQPDQRILDRLAGCLGKREERVFLRSEGRGGWRSRRLLRGRRLRGEQRTRQCERKPKRRTQYGCPSNPRG